MSLLDRILKQRTRLRCSTKVMGQAGSEHEGFVEEAGFEMKDVELMHELMHDVQDGWARQSV